MNKHIQLGILNSSTINILFNIFLAGILFSTTLFANMNSSKRSLYSNRIIVKLKNVPDVSSVKSTLAKPAYSIQLLDPILKKYTFGSARLMFPSKIISSKKSEQNLLKFLIIDLDVGLEHDALLRDLNNDNLVQYAERQVLPLTKNIPNDSRYNYQSYLPHIGSETAWDKTTGSSDILLAIIDTGVDWNHEDLKDKIWVNTGEVLDGTDTDGNGYIDDIRGWDFVDLNNPDDAHSSEDAVDEDNDPSDIDSHGTHCAGIAAAKTNNGLGIAGAGWETTIMPIRAGYMDPDRSGLIQYGYEGVIYAADNGANIISLSWGSYGYNQSAQEMIDYAWDKGCLILAAAGNEDTSDKLYPAAYNHVISVAATNTSDIRASFSNYGAWIDISAPGVAIMSTIPGGYDSYSGTSMATPLAAGVASLLWSYFPDFSNEEVALQLVNSAININDLNPAYENLLGRGVINMENCLQTVYWPPQLDLFKFSVIDDDNGNGFAEPNEEFNIELMFINKFLGGEASNIQIFISNPDSLVMNLPLIETIPSMALSDTIIKVISGLKIDSLASKNSTNITLEITADSDYSLDLSFTLGIGQAQIVLIDDDDGNNNVESFYTSVFDSLNIIYEHYDHSVFGTPTLEYLQQFPSAIWSCEWAFPSLTLDDRSVLADYMDGGGNVFISGQDLGWDLCANNTDANEYYASFGKSRPWYENYLKSKYLEDDYTTSNESSTEINGVNEYFLSSGLSFSIQQPGIDAENQYPDIVAEITPAEVLFTYTDGRAAGVAWQGDYKIVNLGFGFEAINDFESRKILMNNIIEWFSDTTTFLSLAAIAGNPSSFLLFDNYPNPFNPVTTIPYQLTAPGKVSIDIFNYRGQRILHRVPGFQSPGMYSYIWNGRNDRGMLTASGIYFYRLTVGHQHKMKKMLYIK